MVVAALGGGGSFVCPGHGPSTAAIALKGVRSARRQGRCQRLAPRVVLAVI